MPNPPTSAVYQFFVGSTFKTLTLNFDTQWNIVNSSINSTPISGSYNPATGEITFLEHPAGWWPMGFPYFDGYFFMTPTSTSQQATFAGVFDQTVLVHSGTWPNIILQWKRIENGWVALKQ